jgi:hypothetical protein
MRSLPASSQAASLSATFQPNSSVKPRVKYISHELFNTHAHLGMMAAPCIATLFVCDVKVNESNASASCVQKDKQITAFLAHPLRNLSTAAVGGDAFRQLF